MENGCKGKFKLIAVDGEFVEQATVEEQLEKYGLDTESMIRIINEVE